MLSGAVAVAGVLFQSSPTFAAQPSDLPIVDLVYQRQRATFFNETGSYYSFTNIRYAAPPIDANRFRAPQHPAIDRDTLQNGFPDRLCPQAVPEWVATTGAYIPKYLADPLGFNISSVSVPPSSPTKNGNATEDCLFLDVIVPKRAFDKRGKGCGLPVHVWIHGGGYVNCCFTSTRLFGIFMLILCFCRYTLGNKFVNYNPAGLVSRSQYKSSGIIVRGTLAVSA